MSSPYPQDFALTNSQTRMPDMTLSDDSIRKDLGSMLGEDFSDIMFRFSNGLEVVYSHKVILAGRSTVMKQYLSPGGEWNGQSEIRMDEGVDASVFIHLMKYLYSSTATVSYDNVHSLLLLSHRFQVHGLVEACEQYLCENIGSDAILVNLEVAEICNLHNLKSKCTEKLQQPTLLIRLLELDSLKKIALPGLRALLSLEPLPVDEYQLFVAVVQWATAQVGESMPSIPSAVSREAAELCAPLMELIRFPTMNGKELRKLVKPYNVVPPARYIEALEHLADCDSQDLSQNQDPRYRYRHPQGQHETPRRRIEQLTSEVSRLSSHAVAAAPIPPTASIPPPGSPPRVLPSVSQLGLASPWVSAGGSYGTPSRYLPRSTAASSAI